MAIIPPYDILPDNLLTADKRRDVVAWIVRSPQTGGFKVALLRGWAAHVGLVLTAQEYALVKSSGYPVTPVDV